MRSKLFVVFAGAGLLLTSVSAWAHHAFAAEFDVKKPIHLAGVVTKLELVNPHAWIYVDVKGTDGQLAHWMIETGGTPNILFRRGFTKTSVPIGTEVVIDGFQAKDGTTRASGSNVTLPDGRKLFIGSSGTEGPPDQSKK